MDRFLALCFSCFLMVAVYEAIQPTSSVGHATPLANWQFTAVDGTPVDTSKLRGKVVLIDFWATWCGPCRGEVPNVVAAYQKYHDKGFEVVGVSLDTDRNQLTAFTQANGMPWPQYFDGGGWHNQIAAQNGVRSIPKMWLIGKDGALFSTNARHDLAGLIEKALAAPEVVAQK